MKWSLSEPHVFPTFLIGTFVLLAIAVLPTFADGAGSPNGLKVRRNQSKNSSNNATPEVLMVSVDEGETVYISCPLNKTNAEGCEWYKKSPHGGNRKRITQFFDRYQKVTPCQLQIRSVTYEDAGTIICRAISDSAEQIVHASQLIVTGESDPLGNRLQKPSSSDERRGYIAATYLEPEIVKDLFSPDHSYREHRGGNIVVKCEASGNPKPLVSWRRGSKVYSTPTEGYSYLKLTNLTEDDSGVYKCEAINLFGKSVQEINIQVKGTLQGSLEILDVAPKNVTLYEGSQGNVTCIARFEGDPWFVWVKKIENKTGEVNTFNYEGHDYAVLPRTEIKPLGQQLYSTTLILQNVTTLNTGIYHCIVAGLQGYNHSEAYVVVEKDPSKLHMAQIRRHKAVTILWIFSFVIFAALVILCIFKVYGCPNANKGKFISQGSSLSSQYSTKKTQLPKRSPETLSTECTHPRHELFHPLVTHGSCSLASQEPSVLYKDCNSSCETYNNYDPEFSVASGSLAGDSLVLADLEAARSSHSLAGSFSDSEPCSEQSVTSPKTQTSDYYTRRESSRHHRNNYHRPYHHHPHHHLHQQVKSSSENNQSHFPQCVTALLCPSCTLQRPECCSCPSCEPSNLSSISSSDCESQWNSRHSEGISVPHHNCHQHHHNFLPQRDEILVGNDLNRHIIINTSTDPRKKLNPNPNLYFLEKLRNNPNTVTAVL